MKGKFLYKLDANNWLKFYNNSFYVGNELVGKLDIPLLKRFFIKIRMFVRLLRLEPRVIERLTENEFVFCALHKMWVLNIEDKKIRLLTENRIGWSDPLNMCKVGSDIYWGEYGCNQDKDGVKIYRLNSQKEISVVYTFPKNTIRHIHNIIWSKTEQLFYIFTGDIEDCAGIYKSDKDWKIVEPILIGSQQYRAVVGFPMKNGIIYVTDSVETPNNIYVYQNNSLESLASFPGSCIYGVETKSYYVFASTVEPPEGRGFLNMFAYKLGGGIQDRYSHLIKVKKENLEVEEILKVKKDLLPMKLFQYGTIMFPLGQEHSDELLYYIMACKDDGKTNKISL